MDTNEARISPVERDPKPGLVYDGFMSYSHAADDLVAPRLQAGLQRFAKPWWKRRALRVFRDEASLSANPHLWSSIVEAMQGSDWFVLLLSPDAAASEWVNREVEYWLEYKDPNRIIPVVTDGDFAWGEKDIDPVADSAPPALYGAFADEPRWVDLRFARTAEQLDLNNASFRAAVADIASAIRGIPKDELESEEVRQHRRTRRTVAAAVVALLFLAVAATGAALLAIDRGNEATSQRLTAEQNAAEADAQRQVAEQQTAEAERLAAEAQADSLAANAIVQLDTNPDLSLLLAIEALEREEQPASLSAVHQALQRHRTVFELEVEPSEFPFTPGATGGMSPDGDRLVVAGHGRTVELWEIGADDPLWGWRVPMEQAVVFSPRFTVDGSQIVIVAAPEDIFDPFRAAEDAPLIDRLYFLDAETGDEIRSIAIPPCGWIMLPSPMPVQVDLNAPMPWATCTGRVLEADVGLLDLQSGVFTSVTAINPGRYGVPTTDRTGRYFAAASSGPGQVIDLTTGEVVFSYPVGNSTLSADGTQLLAQGESAGTPLELWNIANRQLLWSFAKTLTRVWFSSDESTVYAIGRDGAAYVLDTATGEQILRLVGHTEAPVEVGMSRDGNRLATFASNFTGRVWDLASIRSEGETIATNSHERRHLGASADVVGGIAAVWGGSDVREDELWETKVINLTTGETQFSVVGGIPVLSLDGTRLAYRSIQEVEVVEDDNERVDPGFHPRVGNVRVVDIPSGELVTEIAVHCHQYLTASQPVEVAGCGFDEGRLQSDLEFSPDGRWLAMADSSNHIVVWDVSTGEEQVSELISGPSSVAFTPDNEFVVFGGERLRVFRVESFEITESAPVVRSLDVGEGTAFAEMVLTPDGQLLIGADTDGKLRVIDAAAWVELAPIAAHQDRALDVAVNSAGTLIASAGADGYVRVWNVEDRSLFTEIGFDVDEIANVEFIDDTHLFVTAGFGNEAIVITLDPDELLMIARDRIVRTFTPEECARFEIDPCPTLAELKSGSA